MEPMSNSGVRCEPKETGGRQFPLATLKVIDITEGLDDISRGFYYVKVRFQPKMANRSGWMIYPVDDITGFYCIA